MSPIPAPVANVFGNYFNAGEPAFMKSFDPESARRQLHVSLAMVAAMAGAAFVLGIILPMDKASEAKIHPKVWQSGAFTGTLVMINEK